VKVFSSWSGGKDSCFACYRAMRHGFKVCYLANMITEDGKRSWTHGQSSSLLELQSQAVGIPLLKQGATMSNYESKFKEMLSHLKEEGVEGGVFGDIDLEEHRKWVERVCGEVGMKPYLPLWGESQGKIMREFIASGFEAVVVVAKASLFGEEVLGRKVDLDFVNYLERLNQEKGVTLCGEVGEYHTFVIDGPIFSRRVEIVESRKTLRDGVWILEIVKAELKR